MNIEWNVIAAIAGIVWVMTAILIVMTINGVITDRKIVDMVKSGANPLSAACAVRSHTYVCLAAGMIENKE